MKLFCPALLGKYLPARCMGLGTPGGQNISPPLAWSEVPAGSRGFALCLTDLDAPGKNGVLWFLSKIPATVRELAEDASESRERLPPGTLELPNALEKPRYDGPLIERGGAPHRISIRLWALHAADFAVGPFTPHPDRLLAVQEAAIEAVELGAIASRTT